MAYENLALKYRPQKFEEIYGQDTIVKTLSNSVELKKIAHAYLFYGPRGCGKTSMARILSKTLNCHKPERHNPCNKCSSCIEISQSRSIDVIEIDAASHTQVQNVRDVIIDNVNLSPSRDKYKIYILDEVHMLSNSAFNALLKTIEEPPEHVVFIMATTEINKVPLTIVSRCQTFRFRPMNSEIVIGRLKEICKSEKINYEENALKLIADSAGGAMRDAITLLDRVSSFSEKKITFNETASLLGHAPFELIKEIYDAIISRDVSKVHQAFLKIENEGYDVMTILKDLRNLFAESFLKAQGFRCNLEFQIKEINPFYFAKLSRKLNRIIDEIKFSDNLSLAAQTAIYTIMDTPVDVESLIKKLEKIPIEQVENTTTDIDEQKKNLDLKSPNIKADSEKEIKSIKTENYDSSLLWQKFLKYLSKEKMSIYNFLLSSEITFTEKKWQIALDSTFKKDIIEKNLPFLKDILAKIGAEVDLSVQLLQKEEKIEEISNLQQESIEKNESSFSDIKWVDIDNFENEFPELKKINKVFGNKIKKITKIEKNLKE